jgi:hypothetical protein
MKNDFDNDFFKLVITIFCLIVFLCIILGILAKILGA